MGILHLRAMNMFFHVQFIIMLTFFFFFFLNIYKMSRKLIHFLRKLIGYNLIIELKDDTIIKGKCSAVDSSMNIHLRIVHIKRFLNEEKFMESLTIRGNKIRYIEFPEDINIESFLDVEKN